MGDARDVGEAPAEGSVEVLVRMGIDTEGRPSGSLLPNGGAVAVSFTGWLDLMGELGRLLQRGTELTEITGGAGR